VARFKDFGSYYFVQIVTAKFKQETISLVLGSVGAFEVAVSLHKIKVVYDLVHNSIESTYKKFIPYIGGRVGFAQLNERVNILSLHLVSLLLRVIFCSFLFEIMNISLLKNYYTGIETDLIYYGVYFLIFQSIIFSISCVIFQNSYIRHLWFIPVIRNTVFPMIFTSLYYLNFAHYFTLSFVVSDMIYLLTLYFVRDLRDKLILPIGVNALLCIPTIFILYRLNL